MTLPHARTLSPVRRVLARGLATAATGILATAVLFSAPAPAVTPATAGSLEDKRETVEDELHEADAHLDESSALVRRATEALLEARVELANAESVLAATREELAAAEARDQRMQDRLEVARERLAAARAALADSRSAVDDQATELRRLAAATYEHGGAGLVGLSAVFSAQGPAQIAGGLSASSSVLNSESALLDRLTASQVLLDVQEQETAAAEAEVARRREEAASNLLRKQALEAQAADAANQVAELVEVKAGARESALAVRRTDIRQMDELQAERDRITALIEQQAETSALTVAVDGDGYLATPTQGWVTSGFGWRTHPIFGYRSLHDGIDIGAACGTPIVAPADGTVLSQYYSSSWGNRIIIDHGIERGVGLATISNHLSRYAVSAGDRVERGQVVGYVGTTGWSTGCHLHFTVLQNGVAVDPASWL